jgi:ATP-dependent DNA helicase PIF1
MTQDDALALLKTCASIFLTGQPGSGKTHTVNRYIQALHRQGVEFAYTASTGIAATHGHGVTIHAWSGIGVRAVISTVSAPTSVSPAGSSGRACSSSTRSRCCPRTL